MRFKHLVEQVQTIARREQVSQADAARIDDLLSGRARLAANQHATIERVFWAAATSEKWLDLLPQHIRSCPPVRLVERGYQIPAWPAEPYVRRQIENRSSRMLPFLLTVNTNNPRFYELISQMVLLVEADGAEKLIPSLIDYVRSPYAFSKKNLGASLLRLARLGLMTPSMELSYELVSFRPDPRGDEKSTQRHKDPSNWTLSLEPRPKLDDWEYQEVLVKGVRPLGDFAPLETSRMLIKAVSEMIRLRQRSEDEQEPSAKDSSEIWCDRVDRSDRAHLDSKAALVHTLTYACERVYEHQDDVSLGNLDTALRQARYRVFDRIRYHLYSRHPLRTITWIREAILNYDDYVDSAFGYEFQQMIRLACEQVGRELLSEADRKTIFDQILSGPDKQGFKEWLGDNFTEELYRQRQRYFWLAQLTPFATVLFDKYRALYNELSSERPPPTDDDYSPFSVGETKTGGSRSPKRAEDLLELSDDGLIAFLNDWQDAHRDEKQWWVDVDFDGLGRAFGEAIQSQPARFLAWKDRWFEIERPIYFRYALDVATKRIKGGQHAELKEWLSVCEWVMAQNDASVDPVDDISETSRQRRAWDSARRAVVDLVEACISEEVSVSAEWQPQIYELLRLACTVQDQRLDKNGAIVTPRDYLTDAINTTRGRALENLVSYGWWLRRQERPAPEVFDVLESRFSGKPALSIPEYTLLATSFGRLWGLNADWMQHHVDDFFPKSKQETWKAAFGAFLNFIQPYKPWFELLEPHFELGLDNLQQPHETKARPTFSDSLGWHLFLHYLWGQFDGRPNLLELFYARTRPAEWALLFDQIGRSLKSTNSLSNELSARVKEFFEKRLSVANDEELREFTFWLGAECLDPEWRLRALSRVLDITGGRGLSASILIEDLQKIAGTQPGLVMECFRKLTNAASTEEHFYLLPEPAKAILNIGFASKDPKTIEDAEKAQDNLLSSGHLEYLELG